MQKGLFDTGIICAYCNKDPGFGDNPALWNGFIDKDTSQHVCWKCKTVHYKAKGLTEFKNMYSEFPVMNTIKL